MANNRKKKEGYVQPITEFFLIESSRLIMGSDGDAGGAGNGGMIGEEAKIFESWEFQDHLGIPSDKLDNSLGE